MRLIDQNSALQRYLFRGNTPVESKKFAWDKLRSVLAQTAKQEYNITLPSQYYVVDVSLLNFTEEDLTIEEKFFKENPQLGHLVHWTIVGMLINGTDLPDWLRKEAALYEKKWDFEDRLLERVPQLHDWLWEANSTQSFESHGYVKGTPLVFYIHCEAGMDRTGEVSGSYYLKYLKWTYMKTLAYDYHVENNPRPIEYLSQNALNWFCWHLYYTEGYPLDCAQSLPRK